MGARRKINWSNMEIYGVPAGDEGDGGMVDKRFWDTGWSGRASLRI